MDAPVLRLVLHQDTSFLFSYRAYFILAVLRSLFLEFYRVSCNRAGSTKIPDTELASEDFLSELIDFYKLVELVFSLTFLILDSWWYPDITIFGI